MKQNSSWSKKMANLKLTGPWAMGIKFFALLLLAIGCGSDANLSNSALEQSSKLTDKSSTKATSTGTLLRQNGGSTKFDQIQINGQLYKVSLNSSILSLEFIAKYPLNSQVPIKYKGSVRNQEILLEVIEAQ